MKTFIIAEAGVNHNGSVERAIEMVKVAKEAGADAIKFQTFVSEELVSTKAKKAEYQVKNTGVAEESQYDMVKKLELTFKDFAKLKSVCEDVGIEFMSTPFDVGSLKFLANELKVKRLKIPSGEITNAPFLLEFGRSKLPLILSTGMATLAEIESAIGVLSWGHENLTGQPTQKDFKLSYEKYTQGQLKTDITILQCTTEYPAPLEDLNLNAMPAMGRHFSTKYGYSDHSLGVWASVAAVAMGATVIEKHFTLDKNLPGPDHKASLDVKELKTMIEGIRACEKALGSPIKQRTPSEQKNVGIARRSLVAKKAISKGEKFTSDNLSVKRPGNGLSPYMYWDVLGSVSDRNYQEDDLIIGSTEI